MNETTDVAQKKYRYLAGPETYIGTLVDIDARRTIRGDRIYIFSLEDGSPDGNVRVFYVLSDLHCDISCNEILKIYAMSFGKPEVDALHNLLTRTWFAHDHPDIITALNGMCGLRYVIDAQEQATKRNPAKKYTRHVWTRA